MSGFSFWNQQYPAGEKDPIGAAAVGGRGSHTAISVLRDDVEAEEYQQRRMCCSSFCYLLGWVIPIALDQGT